MRLPVDDNDTAGLDETLADLDSHRHLEDPGFATDSP